MPRFPRPEFTEEKKQLPGRIAEIARDATSPMTMHELIRELNSRTKLHRTFGSMKTWLSEFRKEIPHLDFDIDTKVRMMFLFRASIDDEFRKKIEKNAASVVFDNKKIIVKYQAKDGSFELNAEPSTTTKKRLAKKYSRYSDTSETEEDDDEEDEEEDKIDEQRKLKARSGRSKSEAVKPQSRERSKKSRRSEEEDEEDDLVQRQEQTPPGEIPEEQEGMIFEDADDGYRVEPALLLEADPYQRGGEVEVEELQYVYEYLEESKHHQEGNHDVQIRQEGAAYLEVQQEEGDVVYEGNIFQETNPSQMLQDFLTVKREFAEEQAVVPNVGEMMHGSFHIFDGSSNINMEDIQPPEYVPTPPHPDPIEETISGRSFLHVLENILVSLDFPETFKELQSKILEKYGKVDHQIKSDVIYSTMHFGLHAAVNCAKAGQISEESTSLVGYLMTLREHLDVLKLPKSGEFKEEIKKSLKNSSNQSKVVPTKNICSILENALMVIPSS